MAILRAGVRTEEPAISGLRSLWVAVCCGLVLSAACVTRPPDEIDELEPAVVAAPRRAPGAPSGAGEADEDSFAEVVPPFDRAPLAAAPRDVLALQTSSRSQRLTVEEGEGERFEVSLVDLAPAIGVWHLLRVGTHLPRGPSDYHLQVDRATRLELDAALPQGLFVSRGGERTPCPLWGRESPVLIEAAAREAAYVQLCEGRVLLRNTVAGHRTSKEWVADFLRDRVPGGEAVTTFVKQEILQDAFLLTAEVEEGSVSHSGPPGAPPLPRASPEAATSLFQPRDLGFDLRTEDPDGRMLMGRWYGLEEQPGVFVSALEAGLVAQEIVAAQGGLINPLDEVELKALNYFVAFDLELYDIGFALGTDHPRVVWSERAVPAVVDSRLPGPDGFADVAPLARTGRVPPTLARRVVATFVGGFKRSHGAFKFGSLSQVNRGSHYGFVEEGVILSSLEPGLATMIVWRDGRVTLETWTPDHDSRLGEVRYARQNGVPLVERDPDTGSVRPGSLVRRWSEGNWSGSQDRRFRTLRAGLCLQSSGSRRFLVYGYFSSVTASAMARVFQAYDCDYAMLLDMNALEHTYLAVYGEREGQRVVHHLDRGMSVLDQNYQGVVVPRFLSYPDNRDFFYVMRRQQ